MFCSYCFSQSFLTVLENTHFLGQLKCPQFDCSYSPTEEEVKRILPAHVFQKYVKFNKFALVAQDPKKSFCPVPDCEGIVVLDSNLPEPLDFVCEECRCLVCKRCQNMYHGRSSCCNYYNNDLRSYL